MCEILEYTFFSISRGNINEPRFQESLKRKRQEPDFGVLVKPRSRCELLVTELPEDFTEAALRERCRAYGEVANFKFNVALRTAVVTFESEEACETCRLGLEEREDGIRVKRRLNTV